MGGGSGSLSSYSGFSSSDDSCEDLIVECILDCSSEFDATTLTTGDVFNVEANPMNPAAAPVLLDDNSSIVGSISATRSEIDKLLRCMGKGHSYKAKIVEIEDDVVEIEIRQ